MPGVGHTLKHGQVRTPTYKSWLSMKQRCLNPNAADFPRYGGRGVTVCDRWHQFENFYADMGDRPEGRTLDRIDNNQGYEPGNCRWATRSDQQKNQRPRRMSDRNLEILKFVEAHPNTTSAEVAKHVGVYRVLAASALKRLEDRGLIQGCVSGLRMTWVQLG